MVTLNMHNPYGKASYLSERILVASGESRLEDGSDELSSWMAQTKATEEEFEIRLKSKGLNLQEFSQLLASKDLPTTPPMGWLEEKERILHNTPDAWLAQHIHMGIGIVVLPFVRAYTEQIRRWFPAGADRMIALDSVLHTLQNSHIRDLRIVADRTVVYAYHLAKEREPGLTLQAYVERIGSGTDEIDKLLQAFPVLARILTESTVRAARNMIEILNRFLDDYVALNEMYFEGSGPVLQSIHPGEGDSHQDGRTVAVLQLDSGIKLVYKPRALDTDVAFADWLRYLAHKGLRYPLSVPLTLSNQAYGWQQFVEHRPCLNVEEVRRYYYRMGVLCGIFYTLQSTDMHYENIVACGDMPYVIDNETLLANNIFDEEKMEFPMSHLYRSVFLSGLIPTGQLFRSRIDFDLSGIAGKPDQTSTNMKSWVLQEDGTDEAKFVEMPFKTSQLQHLVWLDGQIVDPVQYLQEISEGFTDVYRIIAGDKEAMKRELRARFGLLTGRALLRPTYLYGRFLTASQHPHYLRNGLDREKLLEMLWNMVKTDDIFEQIVPAEIADLLHNDIPYFTFRLNDTCLYTSDHKRVPDAFKKTCFQWIEEQLDRYDEDNLASQLRLLKYAIHSAHVGQMELPEAEALDHVGALPVAGAFDPMTTAMDIADYLIEHRLADEGYAAWLGLRNHDNQFRLTVLDFSLYSGTLGIAMFLGLMYGQTGKSVYRDAAVANFRYVLSVMERMGEDELLPSVFNGSGTIIYAGFFLDALWEFPEGRQAAMAQLERIRQDTPEEAKDNGSDELQPQLDFLDGYAGIVTLCLHIWERFAEPEALETARMYADKLIQLLERDQVRLVGFAHGSSGMLYALRKLEKAGLLSPESELIEAMLAFEQQQYERTRANWKDLRSHAEDPFAAHYWCHGAPGVLLGRSELEQAGIDQADREMLLDAMVEHASINPRMSLCHGVFGMTDILLTLKEQPGWQSYASTIDAAVWRLASRSDIASKIAGMKDRGLVSLMLGVAGIGWACLRLVHPRHPSVLTLQFPDVEIGQPCQQEVRAAEEEAP